MLPLVNPSPQQLPMSMTPVEMDLQQDSSKQEPGEQKIITHQSGHTVSHLLLTWLILKVTKLLYKEMPCTGNVSKTGQQTNWIFMFYNCTQTTAGGGYCQT